jgi:hypothetical protein
MLMGSASRRPPRPAVRKILTINGALSSGGVATFTAARLITIASASDDSGRTFTVTGTDVNGNAQTETIAGPATTVTGTLYFRTVTQVTVDDDTAGAITVGMANDAIDVVYAGRCSSSRDLPDPLRYGRPLCRSAMAEQQALRTLQTRNRCIGRQ